MSISDLREQLVMLFTWGEKILVINTGENLDIKVRNEKLQNHLLLVYLKQQTDLKLINNLINWPVDFVS